MRLDSFRYKIGTQTAGFTIRALAGRGGNGEIYIVEDGTGQLFALKICYPSNKLERESIRCFRKIRDTSHVMRIYQAGDLTGDGSFCYVMPAADNLMDFPAYKADSLEYHLRTRGRMSAREIISLVREILSGLHDIHQAGFVHRDLKPENILFIKGEPCIADFGLLCPVGAAVEAAGTAGYYPEELLQQTNHRASVVQDFYAMGKIIYALWSGFDAAEYPCLPSQCNLDEFSAIRSCYEYACTYRRIAEKKVTYEGFLAVLDSAEECLTRLAEGKSKKSRSSLWTVCCCIVLFLLASGIFWGMKLKQRKRHSAAAASVFEEPIFNSAEEREIYEKCTDPEKNPLVGEFFELHTRQSRMNFSKPEDFARSTEWHAVTDRKSKIMDDSRFILYGVANDLERHRENQNSEKYIETREKARRLVKDIMAKEQKN